MERQRSENPRQRRQRLIEEAQDLVADRARPCELCRQRMRYFPVRGQTVVRAPGRHWSWRCVTCNAAPMRMAAVLSGEGISAEQELEALRQLAGDLMEHFDELQKEPPTPLFEEALMRLCWQMQGVGEVMSTYEESIAIGNLIVLKRPSRQPPKPPLLRPTGSTAAQPS